MNPKQPKAKLGPEGIIQNALHDYLTVRGWFCLHTHGSMFQSGFPDMFVTNTRYGSRWIEVKLPEMKGSVFTPAQIETFPKMTANGTGVWILTAANEYEYNKLFKPFNWYTYLH